MTSPRTYTAELAGVPSRTEADAVAQVAAQAAQIRVLEVAELADGVLVADVGPGRQLQVTDLEKHLDRPRSKRGSIAVTTPGALIEYVNNHRVDGTTMWAVRDLGRVVAVLDDHEPTVEGDKPGWGQHRATLQLRPTPEWQHWTRYDGKYLGQADFAEWLEDGITAVTAPPAADLLEACRTLSVQREVEFSSADRPTTGEIRFIYQESDTAKAGRRGQLELPEQINLLLAPWEDCEPRELTAQLRYRLADGHLKLSYKLIRPEELVRAAWEEVTFRINEATGVYVYAGTPRS
jgi:uncharacterized protein YfdQ (DUF2303 family)